MLNCLHSTESSRVYKVANVCTTTLAFQRFETFLPSSTSRRWFRKDGEEYRSRISDPSQQPVASTRPATSNQASGQDLQPFQRSLSLYSKVPLTPAPKVAKWNLQARAGEAGRDTEAGRWGEKFGHPDCPVSIRSDGQSGTN